MAKIKARRSVYIHTHEYTLKKSHTWPQALTLKTMQCEFLNRELGLRMNYLWWPFGLCQRTGRNDIYGAPWPGRRMVKERGVRRGQGPSHMQGSTTERKRATDWGVSEWQRGRKHGEEKQEDCTFTISERWNATVLKASLCVCYNDGSSSLLLWKLYLLRMIYTFFFKLSRSMSTLFGLENQNESWAIKSIFSCIYVGCCHVTPCAKFVLFCLIILNFMPEDGRPELAEQH